MKLIVGLGNPGKSYEETRHNIGQVVVKEFAKRHKVVLKRGLFGSSLSARCRVKERLCLLAVPLSYMNLSGLSVKSLIKKHKISLEDLLNQALDRRYSASPGEYFFTGGGLHYFNNFY